MNETERAVRMWHESWDMRDPDRGATVIHGNCQFEDVARGEPQVGPEAYKADYYRWRAAFPDGECKVLKVIVDGEVIMIRELISASAERPYSFLPDAVQNGD